MSTEAVYSQAPLVTERREIRILVLAPGTGNETLRGELIVESLDYDDLHYTALSYTWSGSVGEHFISIGGAPLYITENLSLALRRIRGPTRPRNMWVDAICINQGDFEEKALQVNMMRDIFASATKTIVWLGEKSGNSDVAMEFIGSLRQRTLGQSDDNSKIEQTCCQAVVDLMQRKWWTRIWVIQEALMSRRVTVQCGEKQLDILNFVNIREASRVDRDSDQPLSSESPFIKFLSNWFIHRFQAETRGLFLEDLIFSTRSFHASVWRDRFFGLLGLATPEARSYLIPDYSDEVPDRLILIRLTMYFLRQSVQPLQYASVRRAINCPSWVPDWTAIDIDLERRVTESKHRRSDRRVLFHAAEDYPRYQPPLENLPRYQEPLALLVRGFVIDRVQTANQIPHLGCIASDDSMTRVESIKTHLREWELRIMEAIEWAWSQKRKVKQFIEDRLVEDKESLIRYLRESNKKGVPWVSSLEAWHLRGSNKNYSGQPRTKQESLRTKQEKHSDLVSDYEAWMHCISSSEHAEQQSQYICKLCGHNCERIAGSMCAHCVLGQEICRRAPGRTVLITDNAGIVFESLAVQEGDIICLLLSCEKMFVLRKADEIHWTLVGTLTAPYWINKDRFWHLVHQKRALDQVETFRLR